MNDELRNLLENMLDNWKADLDFIRNEVKMSEGAEKEGHTGARDQMLFCISDVKRVLKTTTVKPDYKTEKMNSVSSGIHPEF